jgi:acyltransferase
VKPGAPQCDRQPAVVLSPGRWLALDVLRGVAVLLMIQGHTFTALLRTSAYEGAWSRWHALVHGLTAPMFLIGGGLAYGVVIARSARPSSLRLLRRGLTLIVLGYVLQFPRAPAHVWLSDPVLFAGAVRIGPLQLIGLCLLLCELMRALTRTRSQLMAATAAQLCAIALTAPVVWKLRVSQGKLLWLGTWFDGYAGSHFPLFPWAVFFLLGVLVSLALPPPCQADVRAQRRAAALMAILGVLSAALPYAAFVHGHVLQNVYGEHELWHTSPLYVVFRAGAVFAVLGLLWSCEPLLARAWSRSTAPTWTTLLSVLARNSLVAYVAHLLVLYGTVFTPGLVQFLRDSTMAVACLVSLGLIAFICALAWSWQRISHWWAGAR